MYLMFNCFYTLPQGISLVTHLMKPDLSKIISPYSVKDVTAMT